MSSVNIHTTYLNMQDTYTKKYGEKTIVLMQIGGFHEAYATDTRGYNLFRLASILNMVCTKKNKEIEEVNEKYPYMLGFPISSKDKHVSTLINNGFTVVVVDQVSPPPNPKREITGIYSPGTYIENSAAPDNNNIVSFYIEEERQLTGKLLTCIGMSVIDLTTGNSLVYEVYSSDADSNYAFNESLRFIYSYNPKETLVFHKTKNTENELTKEKIVYNLELENKIHHYYTLSHKAYKEYDKVTYQEEFFKKIFNSESLTSAIQDLDLELYSYARVSLVGLLNYAYQHDSSITKELNRPDFFSSNKHVVLGNNAVMQLNVIDNNNLDVGSANVNSLFDVVNNTSTSIGRRYLKARLVNPLTSEEELQQLYNFTDTMITDDQYKEVENSLKQIIDIERLYRKMLLNRIHPFELAQFVASYSSVRKLINIIVDSKTLKELLPKKYKDVSKFCDEVESMFDLSELKRQNITDMNKSFFLKDVYPDIDKLQEEIDYQNKFPTELCSVLSKMIEDSGFVAKQVAKKQKAKERETCKDKTDKVRDTDSDTDPEYSKVKKKETKEGISLTVTKIRCKSLEKGLSNTKKISVLGRNIDVADLKFSPLKDVIKITTPLLDEIHTNIKDKTSQLGTLLYEKYIETLDSYKKRYGKVFQSVNNFIGVIDYIKSNAKTAVMYNYTKPVIDKKAHSYISCENLRHPIIERIIDYDYVPHNVDIGNDLKGMLIYGINSCGKCFAGKTKILMYDGSFKYAKDIATNDLLMGDDSTPRKVKTTIQGKGLIYRISIKDHKDLFVTGKHVLCLKETDRGEITEMTVNEYIKNKSNIHMHKYFIYSVPIEFDKKEQLVDPYIFGNNVLKITYPQCFFDNIKTSAKESRISFIRGILMCKLSNYTKEKRGHKFKFPLGTDIKIIRTIKFVLRSLGFVVMSEFYKNLYFYGNNIVTYDPNKENLFKFSIAAVKKDYYYGFEVNKNKRFLLHNMIVTHNSSLMKSIGLSVIMAQSGMYVPANSYTYSPYNSVYARITGNDNIFKGQSSFTLEMTEMNSILNRSDKNTLVIGDEPAKGTESLSANALVASAVVCLAKAGTSFVFATHLHDIPKLKVVKDLVNVKSFHLSVEYDQNKDILIFNRELKEGSGDPIYGITVANKIIRNKEFITLANSIKSELMKNYNSILPNKKSRYNSKIYISKCALCNKEYEYDTEQSQGNIDTHHITHQAEFRNNKVPRSRNHIQKNQISNLVTLCKKCHRLIHEENIDIVGYVKTSNGKQLLLNNL